MTRQGRAGAPRRTGGHPNRAAGITPEMVLDHALALIDEAGIEGFSMRKLAGRLGVAPPTIYWHVGNKDVLFDRVLDHLTEQLGELPVRGRSPKQRLASVADTLRHEMARHPQLVSLAYHQGRGAAIYSRAQDVLDEELAAAGLPPARRQRALTDILLHVGGFLLVERALHTVRSKGRISGRAEVDPSFRRILDAILDRHLGA